MISTYPSTIRVVRLIAHARVLFVSATMGLLLQSCTERTGIPPLSHQDSLAIVNDNVTHRAEVDSFFRFDLNSPFKRDTTAEYSGIKWFPIDPLYCGKSVLHRYDKPETVIVMGTKGEERRELRYGYFEFAVPGGDGAATMLRLNVYKFTPYDGQRYVLFKDHLSMWFTDNTTGKETYDVGRYIEIGNEHPDRSYVYTIDLNKAFNPYCAYTKLYSCAIPRKEDHLNITLRVGEMKYHSD